MTNRQFRFACLISLMGVATRTWASPEWKRLEGTVELVSKQEYQVMLSTTPGTSKPVLMSARIASFRGGHAVRWTDLRKGDRVVFVRSENGETRYGPVGGDRADGTVLWVDTQTRIFRLKSSEGSDADFVAGRDIKITRSGVPIDFDNLSPGDIVHIRFKG